MYIDLDTFEEIWHTITRNRTRSLLTAFGVFWGVFMLVILVGVGEAFQRGVDKQVGGFAQNSSFIWANKTTLPYKGLRKGRWWRLENQDVLALKQNFPAIKFIAPYVSGLNAKGNNVVHHSGEASLNLVGTSPTVMQLNPVEITYGRYLNEIDILQNRKVCVIGPDAYDEFFKKGQNPVGEVLKINGAYYTIVGCYEVIADQVRMNGDPNNEVHAPYTTLQRIQREGEHIDWLGICLHDHARLSDYKDQIAGLIRQRHQIAPDDKNAVYIFDTEEVFMLIGGVTLGLQALIWVVGLGTLLAGVVGVSNIMLISVRERTLEIGIRRALGAKPKQILLQIISESVTITTLAGCFGLSFAVLILAGLEFAMAQEGDDIMFQIQAISFPTTLVALAVIIISGLFAGCLPAMRALDIKAIEALRDE